jgi:hypothetical protein
MSIRCRKCTPVVWHHADGWDVYPGSECQRTEAGALVPRWFDAPIVEDFPTRKAALAELAEWHPFGVCLVTT